MFGGRFVGTFFVILSTTYRRIVLLIRHNFDCKMHELLYSGQLLALTTDDAQVQHEAVSFLQHLVEPVLVVSIHGPAHSGKTSLVHRLFDLHDDDTATEYCPIPIFVLSYPYF